MDTMKDVNIILYKEENMTNIKEAYKINLIEIVKQHKFNCKMEDCNVSLYLLRMMAEDSGIKFTEEEKELFL